MASNVWVATCVSDLLGPRITSSNSGFHTNPHAMEEDRIVKKGIQLGRWAGGTELDPIKKDDGKLGLHPSM